MIKTQTPILGSVISLTTALKWLKLLHISSSNTPAFHLHLEFEAHLLNANTARGG